MMDCEDMAMFTIDGIRKLHGWTHSCLGTVTDHIETIPREQFVKDVPGFGFSTLQRQLVHVFNCEGLWIHALQGLEYDDCNPSACPTIDEVKHLRQQVSKGTSDYLSRITDRQLNTDTELRFPDGDIVVRTPALVLHHVFTHAFHHKGQMVTMCRALGYPAPDTDLNWFN
jgi:uncharacterized damage-inducible protein DinB